MYDELSDLRVGNFVVVPSRVPVPVPPQVPAIECRVLHRPIPAHSCDIIPPLEDIPAEPVRQPAPLGLPAPMGLHAPRLRPPAYQRHVAAARPPIHVPAGFVPGAIAHVHAPMPPAPVRVPQPRQPGVVPGVQADVVIPQPLLAAAPMPPVLGLPVLPIAPVAVAQQPLDPAEDDPAPHVPAPFPYGMSDYRVSVGSDAMSKTLFKGGRHVASSSETPQFDAVTLLASNYLAACTQRAFAMYSDAKLPKFDNARNADSVLYNVFAPHVWDTFLNEHHHTRVFAFFPASAVIGVAQVGEVEAIVDRTSVQFILPSAVLHYPNPGAVCTGNHMRLHFVVLWRSFCHVFMEVTMGNQDGVAALEPAYRYRESGGSLHLILDGRDHRGERSAPGTFQTQLTLVNHVPTILVASAADLLRGVPSVNYAMFRVVYRRLRASVASLSDDDFETFAPTVFALACKQLDHEPVVDAAQQGRHWYESLFVVPSEKLIATVTTVCHTFWVDLTVFFCAQLVVAFGLLCFIIVSLLNVRKATASYAMSHSLWALTGAPLGEEVWRMYCPLPRSMVSLLFILAHWPLSDVSISQGWNAIQGACTVVLLQYLLTDTSCYHMVDGVKESRRPKYIFQQVLIHALYNAFVMWLHPIDFEEYEYTSPNVFGFVCLFIFSACTTTSLVMLGSIVHLVTQNYRKLWCVNLHDFALYYEHGVSTQRISIMLRDLALRTGCPRDRFERIGYTIDHSLREFSESFEVYSTHILDNVVEYVKRDHTAALRIVSSMSAVVALGVWIWLLSRIVSKIHVKHLCYCCGHHASLPTVPKTKCSINHPWCRPERFFQVGPHLPEHTPLIYSSCSHNMSYGLARRMLVNTNFKTSRSDPEGEPYYCEEEMDLSLHYCQRWLSSSPLTWDWPAFIAGKPATSRRRAERGLAALLRDGATVVNGVLNLQGLVRPIETRVSFFNKREFYDYIPFTDKLPKPRIISSCSDEVLAYLGPYFTAMDHKLKHMPFLAKHRCAEGYALRAAEVRDSGFFPLSTDLEMYDRSQNWFAMEVQHSLFRLLGLPLDVVSFLGTYDLKWRAGVYASEGNHRFRGLRFSSANGIRKSGDPHTSVGNNLFHWFMFMHFLRTEGDFDRTVALISGDDFLGAGPNLNLDSLTESYHSFGVTLKQGAYMEFCGGQYLGESVHHVRDPHRALFKFGWMHSSMLERASADAVLKSIAICHSYGSVGVPIMSALVARAFSSCETADSAVLNMNWSYTLSRYSASQLNQAFTTEVEWSMRVDYALAYGIPPGLQILFEQQIAHCGRRGALPALLGRLL